MDSLTPLQGMKDVFDSRARSKRIMLNNLVEFLESSNFDQIDLPLLEGTDLLLKKSGGTLASKMYSFEDPGGRNISLRPEFTSSVVRAYLNEDIDPKITTKVFYYGQIFRYSTENVVNLREYTQVGCEVIGASTHSSDIELLMTAIKGTNLFLKDCSMRIGHMGIINQILNELNLSDRLKFFISEHLNIIKEGDSGINRLKEMALKLGLISDMTNGELSTSEDRGELLQSYLKNMGMYNLGVRTIDEIQTRFLNKGIYAQSVESFISTLKSLYELISNKGGYNEILSHLSTNCSQKVKEIIEDLSDVIEIINKSSELNNIEIDLTLGRDIPYYTGLVFQVTSEYQGEDIIVSQGGRYDDLVGVLGNNQISTPALGFAWNLDALQMISEVGR